MDDTKNESKRLEKALNLSADLSAAYTLKEMLYDLWEQDDEEEGFQSLTDWIADAEWSNIPEMPKSLRALRIH